MNTIKFKHMKNIVGLYDSIRNKEISLGKLDDHVLTTDFCQQTMGIWSRQNNIEWAEELSWNRLGHCIDEESIYVCARSHKHSLKIEMEDYLHSDQSIFLRKYTLHNESNQQQNLKMIFQQDFDHVNGTTFFSLSENTLYHERQGQYLAFNGSIENRGISQYTTFQKNDLSDTPFMNIDKGTLYFNPISTGKVRSAFSILTSLLPQEFKSGFYWVITGDSINEINLQNEYLKRNPDWLVKDFIENNKNRLDKIVPIGK